MKAIRQCLGEERATDEVVQAWTEAYWFLADILVAKETERREARGKEKGAKFVIPPAYVLRMSF